MPVPDSSWFLPKALHQVHERGRLKASAISSDTTWRSKVMLEALSLQLYPWSVGSVAGPGLPTTASSSPAALCLPVSSQAVWEHSCFSAAQCSPGVGMGSLGSLENVSGLKLPQTS